MSHYVFGDIQGCYEELESLLELIDHDPNQDTLIFAGDIINRGPLSLKTIELICALPNTQMVLGNHDLYFLAIATGAVNYQGHHSLEQLLAAPNVDDYVDWLRHKPLLIEDKATNTIITHAGFPPQWSIAQAQQYAAELEQTLQSEHYIDYLKHMVGNQPSTCLLYTSPSPRD